MEPDKVSSAPTVPVGMATPTEANLAGGEPAAAPVEPILGVDTTKKSDDVGASLDTSMSNPLISVTKADETSLPGLSDVPTASLLDHPAVKTDAPAEDGPAKPIWETHLDDPGSSQPGSGSIWSAPPAIKGIGEEDQPGEEPLRKAGDGEDHPQVYSVEEDTKPAESQSVGAVSPTPATSETSPSVSQDVTSPAPSVPESVELPVSAQLPAPPAEDSSVGKKTEEVIVLPLTPPEKPPETTMIPGSVEALPSVPAVEPAPAVSPASPTLPPLPPSPETSQPAQATAPQPAIEHKSFIQTVLDKVRGR